MTDPVLDPIMQSLASALAGQAASTLTAAGKKALEMVRDLVSRKAADDPRTHAALEAAEDREPDHPKVKALAKRLDQLAAQDPAFGQELRAAGEVLHEELSATTGGVVNKNSGQANTVVQGHTFGNITFNS